MALVPARRGPPQQGRRLARGLGLEPLRPAAVRALLQVVHREGLGRADDRDPRRVGGAAHQGALVLLRGEGRVLRQQGQQGQEPHLGVQLPALRARADVGGDDATRSRSEGGEVRLDAPRRAASSSRAAGSSRSRPAASSYDAPGRGHLLAAAARRGRDDRARRRRRRCVDAARGLRYRDFLTVALVVDGEDLFPDNWIYIHEPGVRVGRIQNYRSWSPWMVPDPDKACVGLEYFCFAGDDLWTMDDDDARRARRAASSSSSASRRASKVERGFAIRVPKAYPIYDADYAERVATIRALARRDREPAAGRPQRPAPLQQLGSLDADRDARRRQPARRARTTTSGRSTRRASTTRPTWPTSIRTAPRPRRPRCRRSRRPGRTLT